MNNKYLIMRDKPEVLEFRNSLEEAEKFAETIKPKTGDNRPSVRVYIYEEVKTYTG